MLHKHLTIFFLHQHFTIVSCFKNILPWFYALQTFYHGLKLHRHLTMVLCFTYISAWFYASLTSHHGFMLHRHLTMALYFTDTLPLPYASQTSFQKLMLHRKYLLNASWLKAFETYLYGLTLHNQLKITWLDDHKLMNIMYVVQNNENILSFHTNIPWHICNALLSAVVYP